VNQRRAHSFRQGISPCACPYVGTVDGISAVDQLRSRHLLHDFHVAVHRLCQLRIHFVRDSHNIR